jgi:hypothetical protein
MKQYDEDPYANYESRKRDDPHQQSSPNDSMSTSTENETKPIGVGKLSATTSLFNNNVSGSIGSGVEAIKRNNYLNAKFNAGSPAYNTVEKKKLIKTENGLVYTSINKDRSSDALMVDDSDENPYQYADDSPVNRFASTTNTNSLKKLNGNKLDSNFKNELSLKLKSINTNRDDDLYSKNYSNVKYSNTLSKNGTNGNNYASNQEHLSNSTATTSVSSASSCASNCDLIIYNSKTTTSTLLNGNNNTNNEKNYSLLKTTLNGSESAAITTTAAATNKMLNGGVHKPPILKPKPRNYSTNPMLNQSGEPLMIKETSLQASPSTSITDVSSTNCTPQHYMEQDFACKSRQVFPRSRSNSLTRTKNVHNNNNNKVNNNATYNTMTNMKTFGPTANQPSTQPNYQTLHSNGTLKKNLVTIDDEINALNTNARLSNSNYTKTLERRQIKNSEC